MITCWYYVLAAALLLSSYGCQLYKNKGSSEAIISYSHFDQKNGWQIWQRGLNHATATLLTNSKYEAYYPTWVAADTLIYSDHHGQLWIKKTTEPASGAVKQISSLPKNCSHPAASPSGRYLASACFTFFNRSEDSDLYITDLKTGSSERIIVLDGIQKHPAWSPDGKKLVFSTGFRKNGQKIVEQLWMLNLDNKFATKIVDNGFSNINPAWSPDGQSIAYASNVSGSMDIWTYNIFSKHSQMIIEHRGLDIDPTWSADQENIVFVSTRSGHMGLWMFTIASGHTQRLLTINSDIHEPVWKTIE